MAENYINRIHRNRYCSRIDLLFTFEVSYQTLRFDYYYQFLVANPAHNHEFRIVFVVEFHIRAKRYFVPAIERFQTINIIDICIFIRPRYLLVILNAQMPISSANNYLKWDWDLSRIISFANYVIILLLTTVSFPYLKRISSIPFSVWE